MTRFAAAAFLTCVLYATSAHGQVPAIFGELTPGPYLVGFRTLVVRDDSRVTAPDRDYFGTSRAGDRSRPITIHLWYPASADRPPMAVGDVMDVHGAEEGRARRTNLRAFITRSFGDVTDDAWERFLSMALLARRDAAVASGVFPLVLGQLRPFSIELTNELLASHGYVVAMTTGPNVMAPTPAQGLEVATRDMEFAWARLKSEPFIDGARLAVLGFSGSGFSQILLAMRNPDVDAVIDLESAIFDDRVGWPLTQGFGYDPLALRAPFLHTYSVALSKLENVYSEFEKMRYSHRFRYLVDAPQIHHWDFATEGMAASAVFGLRSPNTDRLRNAFEMTNRYVLNFLNAFVKNDAAGLAFLRREPIVNGAAPDSVTVTELAATRPAPAADDMISIVERRGIEAALAEFHSARQRDPQAPLFLEPQVNQMAYLLLRNGKVRDAIEFFKWNVETYAVSANARDSLAEAYEQAGEPALAIRAAEEALRALESQPGLNDETRTRLRQLQVERLARLKAP